MIGGGTWERDEFHLAAIVQNLKTLALRAPDCPIFRVVCLTASAERHLQKGRNPPSSSRISRVNGSPIENTNFFDSIGQTRTLSDIRASGPAHFIGAGLKRAMCGRVRARKRLGRCATHHALRR